MPKSYPTNSDTSHRSRKRFAKLPRDMLKSVAYTTLTHAARSVLTAIAAQYMGANNGKLVITLTAMQEYGIASYDTIYKAERLLVKHKLIVRTRRGQRTPQLASLYALTWCKIDKGPHGLLPTLTPTHAWATYTLPTEYVDS